MDNRLDIKKPLISVLMCTYNARPFIEAAITSILSQTYNNWELVISDDCSGDGTREWLTALNDKRVRLFLQEKNLGYVANKNFCIGKAEGDYITQLDNDDTCPPDRLLKQMEVFFSDPSQKIVGCTYDTIDVNGHVYGGTSIGDDQFITSYNSEKEYPFWFPSLICHRSVYEKVGVYDEYFAGVLGDDLYWTVKANEKFPIYCLKDKLYAYRNNPNSITNVLNNERKMIMPLILNELFRQRKKNGSDWLQEGRLEDLEKFEIQVLNDKKYMSEQYRVWAAKAINTRDFVQAKLLLAKALKKWPLNVNCLRTYFYYLRLRTNK
jgi:glycosyltransferase involved in cell wall biosynthesis